MRKVLCVLCLLWSAAAYSQDSTQSRPKESRFWIGAEGGFAQSSQFTSTTRLDGAETVGWTSTQNELYIARQKEGNFDARISKGFGGGIMGRFFITRNLFAGLGARYLTVTSEYNIRNRIGLEYYQGSTISTQREMVYQGYWNQKTSMFSFPVTVGYRLDFGRITVTPTIGCIYSTSKTAAASHEYKVLEGPVGGPLLEDSYNYLFDEYRSQLQTSAESMSSEFGYTKNQLWACAGLELGVKLGAVQLFAGASMLYPFGNLLKSSVPYSEMQYNGFTRYGSASKPFFNIFNYTLGIQVPLSVFAESSKKNTTPGKGNTNDWYMEMMKKQNQ